MTRSDYGRDVTVCDPCFVPIAERLRGTRQVKIARSAHVGEHRTVKRLGQIASRLQHREIDEARRELAYNALCHGGNAILRFSLDRDTASESSESGNGTHHYSVFSGRGEVALIEPTPRKAAGAIVTCPTCGRGVSSAATTCPGCGHPAPFELLRSEEH